MSRDWGAGAYSQSARAPRPGPAPPAATGEAGLLTISRWPPRISATLTYPAGATAHRAPGGGDARARRQDAGAAGPSRPPGPRRASAGKVTMAGGYSVAG